MVVDVGDGGGGGGGGRRCGGDINSSRRTFHGVFEAAAINITQFAVNVKFVVKTGTILTVDRTNPQRLPPM